MRVTESGKTTRDIADLNAIVDALTDVIVARVCERIEASHTLRPRLLTVAQAAMYLGRSGGSVRSLAARGAFPVMRADGRVQFDIRDLDRWIEENKIWAAF